MMHFVRTFSIYACFSLGVDPENVGGRMHF